MTKRIVKKAVESILIFFNIIFVVIGVYIYLSIYCGSSNDRYWYPVSVIFIAAINFFVFTRIRNKIIASSILLFVNLILMLCMIFAAISFINPSRPM
ncbi:hypothetical protein [Endomicrobium proavitum]|uniref:hypothetical protein n=1 Tax=Endomicrobium proavitum TaxID=1408281 RepID=UPI000696840E|nr:hypothetical protein [Endomicrobium proavitum]